MGKPNGCCEQKDGSLRICNNPHPLNAALKCEYFKLPTLDNILLELHNAKVFSKLDIKHAYWYVELVEISSKFDNHNNIIWLLSVETTAI